MIEVEAILNSRPLAPRSVEPNDGDSGPYVNWFIIASFADENLDHYKNINYLKRYQLVTYLKQQFWVQRV